MQLEKHACLAAVSPRTALQTESWRMLRDEWSADSPAAAEIRELDARRTRIRPQIVDLIDRFVGGSIGLDALRATLDQRSRTDWDVFGFRGSSGTMFLNVLHKHLADAGTLEAELRAALASPIDAGAARVRLARIVDVLGELRRSTPASIRALQPARAVFFTTMCWHLREPHLWPAFHLSSRLVLQLEEELFTPSGDVVADYFAFRDAFVSLAAVLRLSLWELEHLCWWHERRGGPERLDDEPAPDRRAAIRRGSRSRTARVSEGAPLVRYEARIALGKGSSGRRRGKGPGADHTRLQWLLARIGWALGCRVWIASNDWRRQWEGEALGALTIDRLPPLGLDPDAQRLVAAIDVVWLRGSSQVAAAFEVECTTSVYSGILRMADLAALSPNINFPLYIVAPEERLSKVRRELSRPTFQALELHRRCGFFSGEALVDAAASIVRWASGPAAIERLASRVDDAAARRS